MLASVLLASIQLIRAFGKLRGMAETHNECKKPGRKHRHA